MSVRKSPLSFKQSLSLAYLLMALLFAACTFIGIKTLDYLSQRSQETSSNAITLNTLMQELVSVCIDMERSARQYVVFEDQSTEPLYEQAQTQTMHSYEQAAQRAQEILNIFSAEKAILPEHVTLWQEQLIGIHRIISEPIASTKDHPDSNASRADKEDLLKNNFNTLAGLQTLTRNQIDRTIEQRNQQLQDDIAQRRRWMSQSTIGLVVLSMIMALFFGIWFVRPFKRIETAIVKLGENQFEDPIQIAGPSDIRQLGRQLDWLRLRLSEIDADKSRFLRHTSHELKTPLAALREGIALLQEELAGTLNTNQKDVVQILQQNAITLQNQIEDLLKFNAAAFEARKLKRQTVDLLELIEDQINEQKLQWQARNLKINITGKTSHVQVDPEKISTVISNILSNAIHYSPDEGEIKFHLETKNHHAYIDIIDQGPGLDEEDSKHIYEPFYKGKKQPVDATRGTGIGLSIVHEYVSAHGGQIRLIPIDQGTHFQIELPHAN